MTRRYIDFVKYRGSSVDFPVVVFGDVRIGNHNDGDAVLDVVDAITTVPSILLLLVLASMSFCVCVCVFCCEILVVEYILEDD
jgi:hypothetical protein